MNLAALIRISMLPAKSSSFACAVLAKLYVGGLELLASVWVSASEMYAKVSERCCEVNDG